MKKYERLAAAECAAWILVVAFAVLVAARPAEPPAPPPAVGVSVLDFGAVPNDPSRPCDQAIALARRQSTVILFPAVNRRAATRYYVSGSFRHHKGETWRGGGSLYAAGGSAIVSLADPGRPLIETDNSTLADLAIVGSDQAAGVGVLIGVRSRLDNVTVRNFNVGAESVDNWESVISRSTFFKNGVAGLLLSGQPGKRNNIMTVEACAFARNRYGVIIEGNARAITFRDCTIQGNLEGGIWQRGNNGLAGGTVERCWFEHNGVRHLHINGRANGLRILGNFFVSSGQSADDRSIVLDALTATGARPAISRPELRGNFFYNSGSVASADIYLGSRVIDPDIDRAGTATGDFGTGSPPRVAWNFVGGLE